jgi:hypothetical protein
MSDKALTANEFMPTTVITLESVAGEQTDYRALFGQERSGLIERAGATGLRASETTLCGDKAEMIDYQVPASDQIPARTGRMLLVIAPFGGSTYVSAITVQSTEPNRPEYVHDLDTILTGFQMLPPSGG